MYGSQSAKKNPTIDDIEETASKEEEKREESK